MQWGLGAKLIIERALRHRSNVEYYGFDLFRHLSVSHADQVYGVLSRLNGAAVTIVQGDSRVTLPRVPFLPMDLIYLDGDHSPDGQRADWNNSQRLATPDTVFLIDDYCEADDWGSRALVDSLRLDHDVTISDESDRTAGSGRVVRMATVKRKK